VKRTALAVATAVLLVSCGGSGSSTPKVNPEYADFCVQAADLDAQSKSTHGNDPEAMSDPARMKEAWTTIIEASRLLLEAAPLDMKSDVSRMFESMKQMDGIYASYSYNLGEMKAVPEVAEKLNSIANDPDTAKASERFRAFMSKNCGL
jgi:hypothetical protein